MIGGVGGAFAIRDDGTELPAAAIAGDEGERSEDGAVAGTDSTSTATTIEDDASELSEEEDDDASSASSRTLGIADIVDNERCMSVAP